MLHIEIPWSGGSSNHCSESQEAEDFLHMFNVDGKIKVLLLSYILLLCTLHIDNRIAHFGKE